MYLYRMETNENPASETKELEITYEISIKITE